MCKPAMLILSLLFTLNSFGQQSDFLSFRKKDRTIKSYFKGMPITFVHINGSEVNGIIEKVYNDTINN